MEIPLLQGRDFQPEDFKQGLAFTPVIVNEAAVKSFGWESPIGEVFECCMSPQPRVVGVMKDFHFQSLKEEIVPLTIMPTWWARQVLVRTKTDDLATTLSFMQEEWDKLTPGYPFEYTFLDAQFEQIYGAEERLGRIFSLFSGLAIIIACLGLFGLAAHSAGRRKREIGIRKVLGATVSKIFVMLTKDFTRLVLLAALVAVPIAFFLASRWLEGFAYRIPLKPSLFLVSAGIAFLIALLAVGYQAFQAAMRNPVDTIRYE